MKAPNSEVQKSRPFSIGKKLILMLASIVFATTASAQETKEQKAKRILNVPEKQAPVLTQPKPSQKAKERKAKRILNIHHDKKPSIVNDPNRHQVPRGWQHGKRPHK